MATNKDKLIASAQKLVEKGAFDKAIKEYQKVVQQDDKDVRIWLKIGDLFAKLGKRPEAAETYQKVAEFYSEQGFYLKAVAVYKQILKIDPRMVDMNQRLAELYKQLGLLSDAMKQFEAIAAFYQHEGKTKEALAALKQIVELDPETVANRIKLAELYSREQLPREAIDEFTRAAEQLKTQGRTDDYMKVAERLVFHSPDNRPVSKELARLYIDKGDPRRALPKLQVCFKADPRDTEVLSLLSRAFEALDQRPKAVSVLKELARVLTENGDRKTRDDIYRKILTLAPNDAEAEAALGAAPARRAGSQSAPMVPPPARPVQLGASWPPPEPIRDEPPADEFDDAPESLANAEVARKQSETTVGKVLDGPPGAPEEEEIPRILNETDVYIKYKLYAKAIEHVQRVFEFDAKHVEAREKLKALYLTVGKREEAVLELWALAEQAEPGRQRRYLREILELDPRDDRAAQLLGEEPAPLPAQPTEQSNFDVDAIEEISDDEFEVSDPSVRAASPWVDSGAIESVEDEGEDDIIPLVVDVGESSEEEAEVDEEPEDRFGFSDDETPVVSEPALIARMHPPQEEFHTDPGRSAPMIEEPARQERPAVEPASESSLEDDLDEADFFIQQSLVEEARALLETLLVRHPTHPLVTAKLRDLEVLERAQASAGTTETPALTPQPASPQAPPPTVAVGAADSGAVATGGVYEVSRRGVIEKGVTAEDVETHYDLGIAYKEMGLYDDAIAEFKLVMKDAARQVQCYLMIGLCCIERNMLTEAIGHFKKGLYVDIIKERESLSLYFELGQAYEKLSDPREALYYYDKVVKQDPNFRNVEQQIARLRSGDTKSEPDPAPRGGDDVDDAFDALLGSGDS